MVYGMENQKARQIGAQSIKFCRSVFIHSSAAVGGSKEQKGPLGGWFDMIAEDDKLGAKTWEEAESSFQKNAIRLALEKGGLQEADIRYLLSGDLLGQSMASCFGSASCQIPIFGLYGACSTCGESLCLGSILIDGGYADKAVCVTSSHFASAEKEFRFPLDYGSQRPLSANRTVTASGAFILSDRQTPGCRARITAITPGKVVDYGLKDSMNMGACMAPAAADTIYQNFTDFSCGPEDYDRIITGDLGVVGQTALIHLLKEKGYDISKVHMDCGIEIYGRSGAAYEEPIRTDNRNNTVEKAADQKAASYQGSERSNIKQDVKDVNGSACGQDTHAGGSGCGCSAAVLSTLILRNIEDKQWKKILFVPTGALLSKTSFNEGNTVPGVAHAVVLEAV